MKIEQLKRSTSVVGVDVNVETAQGDDWANIETQSLAPTPRKAPRLCKRAGFEVPEFWV
jgi:hypothetical protein